MLLDIFSFRYKDKIIRSSYDDRDKVFFRSIYYLLSHTIFPYYDPRGNVNEDMKLIWRSLNEQLSKELGLASLSKTAYAFRDGTGTMISGSNAYHTVCEKYVCADYDNTHSADTFVKDRLSFVEMAFRTYQKRTPSDDNSGNKFTRGQIQYKLHVLELNKRLKRAGYELKYHNGYIQISNDELIDNLIETPFWKLVSTDKWKNVDYDMKTACDLRDTGGRDPAFFAAKALESTIKIISDEKGWTHGGEKGAASFIDNLGAKKNGAFISAWERESLKYFFIHVRNPFGHGAGNSSMPSLSIQQTNWAIEFCMSWVKSLIERL